MTEDQKAKIAWLNRAFHAEKLAAALEAKKERDWSLAERLSRGGGCGGTPSGNGTEDALIRLAQTREEADAMNVRLVRIREEIDTAIRTVEDMDMRAILTQHYLAYETFEKIAERMHYSERTVQYKHKAALDKVCIELHPET